MHLKVSIIAYTDNMAVLYWVRKDGKTKNRFIDRRVAKIREIVGGENVHHIKSEHNPADAASRGLPLPKLIENPMWMSGSPWINDPTAKSRTNLHTDENWFSGTIKWMYFIRTVAFILRWIHYKRKPDKKIIKTSEINYDQHTPFSAFEIKQARVSVIRYFQRLFLKTEMNAIESGREVKRGHWLRKLTLRIITSKKVEETNTLNMKT